MKKNKFIVYSAGCNCERFVQLHMTMVKNQTYKNYTHIVIDDASTDYTFETINKFATKKTTVFRNRENLGWLHNSVKYLSKLTQDDSIVVFVDLDDFFIHDHVLEYLNKIYNESNFWVTYGSFVWFTTKQIEGSPYPKNVVDNNKFREHEWLGVHPQTFRLGLYKKIKEVDFQHPDGTYLKAAYDQALMMPILEMTSNNKLRFIAEPLYVYNNLNQNNLMKTHKYYQISCANYIRTLPGYEKLDENSLIYS